MTRVPAGSHATMKQKTEVYLGNGAELVRSDLESISRPFSYEQAERLNPTPPRRRKRRTKKTKLTFSLAADMALLWSVCAVPSLFMMVDSNWAVGSAILGGFVFMYLGSIWQGICPVSNWCIRNVVSIFGLMLAVTAVISIFINPVLLFFVALCLAPLAVLRFIWQNART
jgi:hypothetical protein